MHGAQQIVKWMGQEIVAAGLHWIPGNKLQLSVGRGCVGWRSWVSAIHTQILHQNHQFGIVIGRSPTG